MSSNENSPVPSPEIINPPNVKIRIFNFPNIEWNEMAADWIVHTFGGELTDWHPRRRLSRRWNELCHVCWAYVEDFSTIPESIVYQSIFEGIMVDLRIEYEPL